MRLTCGLGIVVGFAVALTGGTLLADEGMWLFNKPPVSILKEKHNFEASSAWLDHLRLSAVQFSTGASGSFVSADGLVLTNHNVAAEILQKLSTTKKDYYKDGFLAKSQADEVKVPGLELYVLTSMEDVTAKVNADVKAGMDEAAASAARRKAATKIETEAKGKTKRTANVVRLYHGNQFHLYTYAAYTDVRLVMSPEFDIAFFGGNGENFAYPRYDLDVAFFRVYEKDKPAKVENFLKWSPTGSKEGDLVFVAGHPGFSNRLNTLSHLAYLRDVAYPLQLHFLREKEQARREYAAKSPDAMRQAHEDLVELRASHKNRVGGLTGLMDSAFMQTQSAEERKLRLRIESDPAKKAKYGDAWEKVAAAQGTAKTILKPYNFLERGLAFDSHLFQIARVLVRMAEEAAKPNSQRLREYRDPARPTLEASLFSDAQIHPEYEIAKLSHSLSYWQAASPGDPIVTRTLEGRAPAEVATSLVLGSKLADVKIRKKLVEGGSKAIIQSDDPMIKLALAIDAESRAFRKQRETEVEAVEAAQYAKIAQAAYEDQGENVYPESTSTLRLSFGTVKGCSIEGEKLPAYTTFAGAFETSKKHENKLPFELPPTWLEAKSEGRVDLQTPFNFVSTADIIGGSSGSPVVSRENELVGMIFDGNLHSLVLDFGYEDQYSRAISLDSRAILSALKSIYKADSLVHELSGK